MVADSLSCQGLCGVHQEPFGLRLACGRLCHVLHVVLLLILDLEQALIQYADGVGAGNAKAALEGHAIYDGGYNKVSSIGVLARGSKDITCN